MTQSGVLWLLVWAIMWPINGSLTQQCNRTILNSAQSAVSVNLRPSDSERTLFPFWMDSQPAHVVEIAFYDDEGVAYMVEIGHSKLRLLRGPIHDGQVWTELGRQGTRFDPSRSPTPYLFQVEPGTSQTAWSLRLSSGLGSTEATVVGGTNGSFSHLSILAWRLRQGSGHVHLRTHCWAHLLQSCVIDVECYSKHAQCDPNEGICTCLLGYRRQNGNTCSPLSKQLGESCQNSLQCAKVVAKCRRKGPGSQDKVCKCFNQQVVTAKGHCGDPLDLGQLDWARLRR